MDIYPLSEKNCKLCNITKSIDNFNKHQSTKDGFAPRCKECSKIRIKKEVKPDDFLKDYYQAKKDAKAYDNAIIRRYLKKREQENPLLIVIKNARYLLSKAVKSKGYTTDSYTYELIGCPYEVFKEHIENQFKEGMTWDNHGEWHIDHIIPVSYGINVIEVIALNNYINLQPLWAKDNFRKGNRYIG